MAYLTTDDALYVTVSQATQGEVCRTAQGSTVHVTVSLQCWRSQPSLVMARARPASQSLTRCMSPGKQVIQGKVRFCRHVLPAGRGLWDTGSHLNERLQ